MQMELSRCSGRSAPTTRAQQRPRNGDANALARSAAKKRPWCERALNGRLLWMQPAIASPPAARPAEGRLRWCSSVKAAASAFARVVCLCAPVCSNDEVLVGIQVVAVAPTPRRTRRSRYSGGLPFAAVPTPTRPSVTPAAERFVLDEQAVQRPGVEEAVLAKKQPSRKKWEPPGKSRLRRMSLADVAEDESGENGLS